MRFLLLLIALWPSGTFAQPLCFCLECLNPRIESYYVPAGSMKPTLEIDACISSLSLEEGETVTPGQIIFFNHSTTGHVFIKRVIAVGGQTVQMQQGRLYLDGIEVPWRRVGTYSQPAGPQGTLGTPARCAEGNPPCEVAIIEETIGGATFQTLDIEEGTGSLDETALFTVPAGHVFVLGDNRDNSNDSRFGLAQGGVGFLPVDQIFGTLPTLP